MGGCYGPPGRPLPVLRFVVSSSCRHSWSGQAWRSGVVLWRSVGRSYDLGPTTSEVVGGWILWIRLRKSLLNWKVTMSLLWNRRVAWLTLNSVIGRRWRLRQDFFTVAQHICGRGLHWRGSPKSRSLSNGSTGLISVFEESVKMSSVVDLGTSVIIPSHRSAYLWDEGATWYNCN